jgi:hypothetical protein
LILTVLTVSVLPVKGTLVPQKPLKMPMWTGTPTFIFIVVEFLYSSLLPVTV